MAVLRLAAVVHAPATAASICTPKAPRGNDSDDCRGTCRACRAASVFPACKGSAAATTRAVAALAAAAALNFCGCAAVEVRTAFDDRGAEVALRMDYAAAGAAIGALLGNRPAPDLTLPHADAPSDGTTQHQ